MYPYTLKYLFFFTVLLNIVEILLLRIMYCSKVYHHIESGYISKGDNPILESYCLKMPEGLFLGSRISYRIGVPDSFLFG